jgi:hypothetical protein
MQAPVLTFFAIVGSTFVQAFAYAAFTGAALFGAEAARARWSADGVRVWAAMFVIAFFLMIVFFVASLVASIVMVAGPMAPYLSDLQSAGSDNAAVMSVMTRFVEEQPLAVLLFMLFFAVIWFALTSRLYLAAPATVERGRILTFETWSWTKGAMLRITAARVMLIVPASILAFALGHLVARLFGANSADQASLDALAASNAAGFLLYAVASAFFNFVLVFSLEAGLSTYLYRGLKPADAQASEASQPAA